MSENFDVLIRFITELVGEDAAKTIGGAMEALQKKIASVDKEIYKQTGLLKETVLLAEDLKKALDALPMDDPKYNALSKDFDNIKSTIKEQKTKIGELVKEYKKYSKAVTDLQKAEEKAQQAAIRNLNLQESILNKRVIFATRIASRLQSFGNTAVIGGTAIGAGIIAEASRYAQKMGDATKGTAAFNAELKKIENARGRIDAVLVAQVLPILEVASKVASKVAGIIEGNPELISIALKGAALLVSIGTLAKIAASGFKLYADATFFTAQGIGLKAAEMQLLASNNQLAAAGKGLGGKAAAAGAGVGLGEAAVLIAAPVLGAIIAKEVGNAIQEGLGMQKSTWADIGKTAMQAVELPTKLLLLGLRNTGVISDETAAKVNDFQNKLWGLGDAVLGVIKDADQASSALAKFGENTETLVDAFSKMNDDLLEEDRRFSEEREKISADANKAILKENQSSASKLADITRKSAADRAKIISDFARQSAEDARKYEVDRARIIRDGGIEIARIEQDRLEKLRNLELEHNDRVGDLAANRDAMGLVLEQRKFDRAKEELDRETNIEIGRRRQDLALRLSDLAANYKAERAQKQEQYLQALKENQEKRLAELKEERAASAERIKNIRIDTAERLKELSIQHNEERKRIREAFLAQVRDLDASLLNEQAKKRRAYDLMLADLDRYLAAYRAKSANKAAPPYAEGGYTPNGVIRTHPGEFVATAGATRALERLVGGRLNQQNLVAVASGGSSVQWNDQRRFSGEYTKGMKRQVQQDTLDTIGKVFKKR